MNSVQDMFQQRVKRIPIHGLGLSVDLYSPDLVDLVETLDARGLTYGYLEIFKAAPCALAAIRKRLQDVRLVYHAEGIWITQPYLRDMPGTEVELGSAATHLQALNSAWLNHECATKQMAGYSFGTYVPPLYTRLSADVTAENISVAQQYLDLHCGTDGQGGPLFLLEMPPFTYFGFGTIPIPQYFRHITEQVPCGLVLDIGHLWTVYRYSKASHACALKQFVTDFLDAFPMDRVVEIHLAGLAVHAEDGESSKIGYATLPRWIDAHAAPIPGVLLELLDQVLAHPGLCHLRGLALEVDTKSIPRIVLEFEQFAGRSCQPFATLVQRSSCIQSSEEQGIPDMNSFQSVLSPVSEKKKRKHLYEYEIYVGVLAGRLDVDALGLPILQASREDLELYRRCYLPYEILHWGGDLEDMFPQTCRCLMEQGHVLTEFVSYWFERARPAEVPYDFFLLKIERFVEFVLDTNPASLELVMSEARELRAAYKSANEGTLSAVEVRS
ncbi:MAG: multinuclear nonheme iron-dependent oxidase [Nitrospiraceae bacterium]